MTAIRNDASQLVECGVASKFAQLMQNLKSFEGIAIDNDSHRHVEKTHMRLLASLASEKQQLSVNTRKTALTKSAAHA